MTLTRKFLVAGLIGLAAAGLVHQAQAQPGEHRMGHGHMMEGGPCAGLRDKPLTTGQVRDIIQGRLAWRGDDLKVGNVSEKDADTVIAEVVKTDGKLDHKVSVNRKSGQFSRLE